MTTGLGESSQDVNSFTAAIEATRHGTAEREDIFDFIQRIQEKWCDLGFFCNQTQPMHNIKKNPHH
jgi:hypothetical protein